MCVVVYVVYGGNLTCNRGFLCMFECTFVLWMGGWGVFFMCVCELATTNTIHVGEKEVYLHADNCCGEL